MKICRINGLEGISIFDVQYTTCYITSHIVFRKDDNDDDDHQHHDDDDDDKYQ